jgi:hypothetical protein
MDPQASHLSLDEIVPVSVLPDDEAGSCFIGSLPSRPGFLVEVRYLNARSLAVVRELNLEPALRSMQSDASDSPYPVLGYDFGGQVPFIILRHFAARTLLDVLKLRQSLPISEVVIVLSQLSAALESLRPLCLFQPVIVSLDQVRIRELGLGSGGRLPERIGAGTVVELDFIRVMLNTQLRASQLPLTLHLAELACWLVGHPQSRRLGDRVPKFSPVAELSSEQNQLIKSVFEERNWESLLPPGGFLRRLAGEVDLPAVSRGQMPSAHYRLIEDWNRWPGECHPRLRLSVARQGGATRFIGLSGCGRISLGRSFTCDYVAQFRPRDPVNDSRTRQISRLQLELEWQRDGVVIWHLGSQENSAVAGRVIRHSVKIDSLGPVELAVADDYFAHLLLYPSAFRQPLEIEGLPVAGLPDVDYGGAFILPRSEQSFPCEAWWAWRDLSLTLENGEIRPVHPLEGSQVVARIHFLLERLWIERCGSVPVSSAGRELSLRQLAPLAVQTDLMIGTSSFSIQEVTGHGSATG